MTGPASFSELQQAVHGISDSVLPGRARRLRLLSVIGLSSASVLGWHSSRLPTDSIGMAEGLAPCPWRSTLPAA